MVKIITRISCDQAVTEQSKSSGAEAATVVLKFSKSNHLSAFEKQRTSE
jgi:hypothetical protein